MEKVKVKRLNAGYYQINYRGYVAYITKTSYKYGTSMDTFWTFQIKLELGLTSEEDSYTKKSVAIKVCVEVIDELIKKQIR